MLAQVGMNAVADILFHRSINTRLIMRQSGTISESWNRICKGQDKQVAIEDSRSVSTKLISTYTTFTVQ